MIRLECATRLAPPAALFEALEAIAAAGGWVRDHRIFGSKFATVAFELPARGIAEFVAALQAKGIAVHDLPPAAAADGNIAGFLNITFLHGAPDERRPVPEFG